MRNRPFIWAARLGVVAIMSATVFSTASGPARAATVSLPFNQEGTFWRAQQRAPIVDVPCTPPIPADRCGPASPGPTQSPEVAEGTVAVGHAGGPVEADGGDTYGDQYWAAFEIDLLSVEGLDTVEKLTLTLNRFSTTSDKGTPTVMACNIVTPFGTSEGTNPWADRPKIDCSAAKAPTVSGSAFTFDLTDFAATWVAGTGYGAVIVPGVPGSSQVVNDPSRTNDVAPFHVTFATSGRRDAAGNLIPTRAKADLQYTPSDDAGGDALDLELGGDSDLGFGLGGEVDEFAGADDLSAGGDIGGDLGDVGTSTDAGGEEVAAPDTGTRLPTRRASSNPGFPWIVLLLLPLGAVAFWGTGTALGEAGDPVLPREGGVSRILARRRADSDSDLT